MFGILLVSVSSLFEEIAATIGKKEITKHTESYYAFGFLHMFWSGLLLLLGVLTGFLPFVFSAASLPTFIARACFEIMQAYAMVKSLALADRSTSSFVRAGTIPLLLLVDIFLGYSIGMNQSIGIGIIFLAFLVIFSAHGVSRVGLGFTVFTALNAVFTISLYKYDISHFNSVAGEQLIMVSILLAYYWFSARKFYHENPLKLLAKPLILGQSFASGVGVILDSFAYLFAPASLILTAKRSFGLIWATASGNHYFHESRIGLKIGILSLLIVGLIFLVL